MMPWDEAPRVPQTPHARRPPLRWSRQADLAREHAYIGMTGKLRRCLRGAEQRRMHGDELSDESSYITGTELFVDGGLAQV